MGTVSYSPQQNGVAERINLTVLEKVRSMLCYKGMSTEWWANAMSTSVYSINCSFSMEWLRFGNRLEMKRDQMAIDGQPRRWASATM